MIRNQIASLLRQRECQPSTGTYHRKFERSLHVFPSLIDRLELEFELQGHNGCVNCLEWNEDGSLLASGSDDLSVILWEPLLHRRKWSINTGHTGNIFSVKFLPNTRDNLIVTCAVDHKIRLHEVNTCSTQQVFRCHTNRVKRLATASNTPYLFWSAGEDGTVRQFDLREQHSCQDGRSCANVLVNVSDRSLHNYNEAKCLAINNLRPELLAVGCKDQYVRLYDMRMLKLSDRSSPETVKGCIRNFTAGHLNKRARGVRHNLIQRSMAVTYVTFSPDGKELLANLGGEQIYLFDVFCDRSPLNYTVDDFKKTDLSADVTASADTTAESSKFSSTAASSIAYRHHDKTTVNGTSSRLSSRAESLKLRGNDAYNCKKYNLAVQYYNLALVVAVNNPLLYSNRAAAFLHRGWDGDVYAAMRDCQTALALDHNHRKSWIRLIRCLHELCYQEESLACLKFYKSSFPISALTDNLKSLEIEILKKIENDRNRSNPSEDSARSYVNCSDFKSRYCGHCNTSTDIKEANFFGANSQYIMAGSDDGCFFIWDRETTNLLHVLRGDDSIVNCLQPHPSCCLLATSGIDHVVRLWSPQASNKETDSRHYRELDNISTENQRRMNADPFEIMLLNINYADNMDNDYPIQCRTS